MTWQLMRTLFDKVWAAHEVVAETPDTPAVLYVDLHLIHEVTSPQAFSVLKTLKLPVRRPDRTLATMDHSTPTSTDQVFGNVPIKVDAAAKQVRPLIDQAIRTAKASPSGSDTVLARLLAMQQRNPQLTDDKEAGYALRA